MKTLLVVDIQNDFCEGGALPVSGGRGVAVGVSRLMRRTHYDLVVASRDWHKPDCDNGKHFALEAELDWKNTWPVHCVAGTFGAEYSPVLDLDSIDCHVFKGFGKPAYSAFEGATWSGSSLTRVLKKHGVKEVDIVGLAMDFCVLATAHDALKAKFEVCILREFCAGVNAENSRLALAELERLGAKIA